ncbi:hypothetical protein ABK040_008624 [Willaertia magna]
MKKQILSIGGAIFSAGIGYYLGSKKPIEQQQQPTIVTDDHSENKATITTTGPTISTRPSIATTTTTNISPLTLPNDNSNNNNVTNRENIKKDLKEIVNEYIQQHSIFNKIQIHGDLSNNAFELLKTFNEFGMPTNTPTIHVFSHFISCTDSRLRIPIFVFWTIPHFDFNNYNVVSNRKNSKFERSPYWPSSQLFNPSNSDYFGSGYSRGHLANCGDFEGFPQRSMDDTHLLANNIIPQDYNNNAGYWLRMERWTRYLAEEFDKVHVIAGPAFIPFEEVLLNNEKKKNKQIIHYEVVGKNQVTVPPYLFRVIIAERENKVDQNVNDNTIITTNATTNDNCENSSNNSINSIVDRNKKEEEKDNNNTKEYFVEAFIVPNSEIDKTIHLKEFSVPFELLEKYTGLNLLENLRKKSLDSTKKLLSIKSLCENNKCELPPWQDLEFQKVLWKKNPTREEIESTWNKLVVETNWEPSKDMIRRKNAKLEEI